MKDKILIIGGYGAVGRAIAQNLSQTFPGKVVIAGRSLEKAEALAMHLKQEVIPAYADIQDESRYNCLLSDISLVIMCLDQKSTTFAVRCFEKGIHYIDITANYDFLRQLENLQNLAMAHNATGILSVGLAPGVTNLLAKHCQDKLTNTEQLDIFLLLGTGEKHGTAAYQWIFKNLNTDFQITSPGGILKVKSFGDPKKVFFDNIGKRTAYRFNYSDQHVIRKTLNIPHVSTRMCFDSPAITGLINFMRETGLSSIFKASPMQQLAIRYFSKLPFGSEIFAVKVVGKAPEKEEYTCFISGYNEGKITALATSLVAKKLLHHSLPAGVYHVEELFNPEEFMEELQQIDQDLKICL